MTIGTGIVTLVVTGGDYMTFFNILVLTVNVFVMLYIYRKTSESKASTVRKTVKVTKKNNMTSHTKSVKLKLPSELMMDGHFEAYVLKYFIYKYVIDNKASSYDDIEHKKQTNRTLYDMIITRGISNGCIELQYGGNLAEYMKDCELFYNEMIRSNPKYDPSKPDCKYFETQNGIAMGEIAPKYTSTNDSNLDMEVLADVSEHHTKDSYNSLIKKYKPTLLELGLDSSEIEHVCKMAVSNPTQLTETMKTLINRKQNNATIDKDHFGDVDVDGLLDELGLQ